MIDYSKYFGLTEFEGSPNNLSINSDFLDITFNEEVLLSDIHLVDNNNLFEKYGSFYQIEKSKDSIQLIEKNSLSHIKDHFNFRIWTSNTYEEISEDITLNGIKFIFTKITADGILELISIDNLTDINSWVSVTKIEKNRKIEFTKHSFLSLKMEKEINLSGIRNLLEQFIENNILGLEDSLAIVYDKSEILIFPKINDSISYLESFKPLQEIFISFLQTYSFDQFYNCICEDGCYSCFYDTRFQARIAEQNFPSKNDVLRLIGKLRSEGGVDDLISVRSGNAKIKGGSFNAILVKWKETIFEIFKQKFEFEVSNIYDIEKAPLDAGLLGVCNHSDNKVSINETLSPLNLIVEVIAHEYTHNWQTEKMSELLRDRKIPFQGKLFVEGFAQWVAFRVMDYLGHHTNMTHITLRGIDSSNPDEYSLGFRICRFVEENYGGFFAVIEFIQSGYIKMDDKKITYDEILKKSGIQTYLNN